MKCKAFHTGWSIVNSNPTISVKKIKETDEI